KQNPATDPEPLDMPMLRQFTHFAFKSDEYASLLSQSFVQYLPAAPPNISIFLYNPIVHEEMFQRFLDLDRHLAQRFKLMSVHAVQLTQNQLTTFCAHFDQLRGLELKLGFLTIRQMVEAMTPLEPS